MAYLAFDKRITSAGLATLVAALGVVVYVNLPARQPAADVERSVAADATLDPPSEMAQSNEVAAPATPVVASAPSTSPTTPATKPTPKVEAGSSDRFVVVPKAARYAGQTLVVDVEIKNRLKKGPTEGRIYGVATFVAAGGKRVFVESHPGAKQALLTSNVPEAEAGTVGETYRARLTTKKTLRFQIPEGTEGAFTLVSLAVKDAHAARPLITPVALEAREGKQKL